MLVGKGATRQVDGAGGHGAHAVVSTWSRTFADFCAALVGCLQRLCGAAESLVAGQEASIAASRKGGTPVAPEGRSPRSWASCGPPVLLPPTPTPKG